ncbi:hypothetical protein SNEBB_008494 [Seison nebaliae]|nr:hypothetical protein SNEBB_008494 [Seison nebaliae]
MYLLCLIIILHINLYSFDPFGTDTMIDPNFVKWSQWTSCNQCGRSIKISYPLCKKVRYLEDALVKVKFKKDVRHYLPHHMMRNWYLKDIRVKRTDDPESYAQMRAEDAKTHMENNVEAVLEDDTDPGPNKELHKEVQYAEAPPPVGPYDPHPHAHPSYQYRPASFIRPYGLPYEQKYEPGKLDLDPFKDKNKEFDMVDKEDKEEDKEIEEEEEDEKYDKAINEEVIEEEEGEPKVPEKQGWSDIDMYTICQSMKPKTRVCYRPCIL